MLKRRIVIYLAIVCLVMGIGVISFPHIEQKIYSAKADETAEEFDEWRMELKENMPRSQNLAELFAKMQEYNDNLFISGQSEFTDAWSYQGISFDLTKWGFEDNMIGYIDIPRMKIKLPLYLGATEENMRLGSVHLTETSLPISGNNSNCVIAGHRGYHGAAMFREIERLQLEDEIYITNPWGRLTYRVFELDIINPTDTQKVMIQEGRDLITLITCHPFRQNYQRYVVYAERVIF